MSHLDLFTYEEGRKAGVHEVLSVAKEAFSAANYDELCSRLVTSSTREGGGSDVSPIGATPPSLAAPAAALNSVLRDEATG